MSPNEPANEGTDRIRAWSAGMLAAFNADFRLEVDEEERLGDDWALERGIYWIALTEKTDEEAAGGDVAAGDRSATQAIAGSRECGTIAARQSRAGLRSTMAGGRLFA
jgi:hypothetical protein